MLVRAFLSLAIGTVLALLIAAAAFYLMLPFAQRGNEGLLNAVSVAVFWIVMLFVAASIVKNRR